MAKQKLRKSKWRELVERDREKKDSNYCCRRFLLILVIIWKPCPWITGMGRAVVGEFRFWVSDRGPSSLSWGLSFLMKDFSTLTLSVVWVSGLSRKSGATQKPFSCPSATKWRLGAVQKLWMLSFLSSLFGAWRFPRSRSSPSVSPM